MNESPQPPVLQRRLSFTMIVLYGLGTTIGAGIYVLIGKVAGAAGIFAPFSFIMATILAGFSVFSFAELSSRFPFSAGEAVYVAKGLGSRRLALVVGLAVMLAGIVSSAAISRGFLGYLGEFMVVTDWIAIVCLVLVLGAIAFWGIGQSVFLAGVATVIECVGLLIVIVAASGSLTTLPDRALSMIPGFEISAWSGIFAGAVLAFYAFLGFEDMVNVAEEVKDVNRTLPRALIVTLVVTAVFYILLTLVAVLSLSIEELTTSPAPLALLFERSTGASSTVISVIALVAILNGALVQIIMASRVIYGLSMRDMAPKYFGRIHRVTHTPYIATAFVTVAVLIFALWLPLVSLAGITAILTLIIFALVNLSLWRIKATEKSAPDKDLVVQYPIWVPIIGFAGSSGFVILLALGAMKA
ncbi:MAG: amino acid permease [Alphaproteobacteria bacterium]|nr:amino acid permease [Alphaproteobacteria bacterium]